MEQKSNSNIRQKKISLKTKRNFYALRNAELLILKYNPGLITELQILRKKILHTSNQERSMSHAKESEVKNEKLRTTQQDSDPGKD